MLKKIRISRDPIRWVLLVPAIFMVWLSIALLMMFLDAKFAGVPCRENRYLEICLLRAQYSSLYLKFSIALSAVSAAITAYGVAPKHKMYVVWGLFLVGCVAAYVISTGEFDLFISAFLGGLFAAMALSAWSVYNNSHHSPH